MIVKRSIILLLCLISLVSAISNTTYVKLLHDEHKINKNRINDEELLKLNNNKNRLAWINCIFMWIFSLYTVESLYSTLKT